MLLDLGELISTQYEQNISQVAVWVSKDHCSSVTEKIQIQPLAFPVKKDPCPKPGTATVSQRVDNTEKDVSAI